ncbi:MAG: glycosyltransferase [bacterium]|nr:glycosyltransferase [candidate division KSB1 bacterium]MDH7559973.1 glycosyltransferase [bacterium]
MAGTVFSIALIALGGVFALFLLGLLVGLLRKEGARCQDRPTVSVVVAARNEERQIGRCAAALLAQDYPRHRLQIVIVDDRSDDATAAIVERMAAGQEHLELVRLSSCPSNWSPKKHAIAAGVARCRGEVILCTDADCVPPPGWVSGMVSYFTPGVGLVAGFSPGSWGPRSRLLLRLMEMDDLALACVAAGSIGIGVPLTCSGANLAYRKEVYEEVGGFSGVEHLLSGDDDLFLHKVRATSWRCRYARDAATIVPSGGPESFRQFRHQRTRHASKGFFYPAWLTTLLILIYLFHCGLMAAVPMALLGVIAPRVVALAFATAFVPEFLLVGYGAALFRRKRLCPYVPLAALLYIPYVVVFAVWGTFGKFAWKGAVAHRGYRVNEVEA